MFNKRKWSKGLPIIALLVILLFAGGATGATLENNDAFCASCHTNPESTYVMRSQAAIPTDLASVHTGHDTRCIDCHSGPGVGGRIHAMTLGATDTLKFLSRNYPQPAPLTQPISDSHCIKCHSDILVRTDFSKHFHSFLPRWQEFSDNAATCVDCHQSHISDGVAKIGFLNEQHTVQVCQDCHRVMGE